MSTIDRLRRRMKYGGRKGRSAARKLRRWDLSDQPARGCIVIRLSDVAREIFDAAEARRTVR